MRFFATLKELRTGRAQPIAVQLPQSYTFEKRIRDPRVAKSQPWAGISERLQSWALLTCKSCRELHAYPLAKSASGSIILPISLVWLSDRCVA